MISFYSTNLIDQASVSASSVNALFPVSNIFDYRRTKVLRTNTNSDSIVFDFNETSQIDSIIMVDSSRDGFGIVSATLQLNSTDSWATPAFTVNLVFNIVHGIAYADFDLKEYRFARLVIESTLDYCELSKVFIGKKITFESGMGIDLGWSYQDKDLSTVKENRYGQKFVDIISRQKQINFAIRAMNKTEFDQVMEVYDDKGSTKPFFVRIGCDDMVNDKDRFAGMFYLSSVPSITNSSFGLYDIGMNIEEAM